MKLPFVSRERLEEQQARCEKLEAEVRELLLLALPGLRPAVAKEMDWVTPETDLSKVQPISGRPTIASLTARANQDARKRASDPNAKPIPQELREAQFKGWKDAKRVG